MSEEIWMPCTDCLKYEVSNQGRVRTIKTGRILKPITDCNGYLTVHLMDVDNGLDKHFFIHRLEAKEFIVNFDPETNTVVNHIDTDRQNNMLNNLEWTSSAANTRLAIEYRKNNMRIIEQVDGDNNIIESFSSAKEAALNTGNAQSIRAACRNGTPLYGLLWRYKIEDYDAKEDEPRKSIPGFSQYEITESGKIYTTLKNSYMKPAINRLGYHRINLKGDDGKSCMKQVHQLAALTYIPNPENKPFINHKDNDPKNNHISNLEWCTQTENMQHALKEGRLNEKGVCQFSKDGKFIAKFDSCKKAGDATKIDANNLNACCRNRKLSAGGFIWRFITDCVETSDKTYTFTPFELIPTQCKCGKTFRSTGSYHKHLHLTINPCPYFIGE